MQTTHPPKVAQQGPGQRAAVFANVAFQVLARVAGPQTGKREKDPLGAVVGSC